MALHLAEQLTLPPDAASEVWAFLGRRGSGKTYAAGLDACGAWEPLPTGWALVEHWMGQLPKAERAILEVLVSAYPAALSKADVGERTGYEPTGGGLNNALGRLRTLELIERGPEIRASADLMEAVKG